MALKERLLAQAGVAGLVDREFWIGMPRQLLAIPYYSMFTCFVCATTNSCGSAHELMLMLSHVRPGELMCHVAS